MHDIYFKIIIVTLFRLNFSMNEKWINY